MTGVCDRVAAAVSDCGIACCFFSMTWVRVGGSVQSCGCDSMCMVIVVNVLQVGTLGYRYSMYRSS